MKLLDSDLFVAVLMLPLAALAILIGLLAGLDGPTIGFVYLGCAGAGLAFWVSLLIRWLAEHVRAD